MNTPHSRLIAEALELDIRLNKLKAFIDSPGFEALSPIHRDLLVMQRGAMDGLLSILHVRSKVFKAEEERSRNAAGQARHGDPARVIVPTVGRKVWYWPSDLDVRVHGMATMPGDPVDATIIAVSGLRCVNLHVIDAVGGAHARPSCALSQPGDSPPEDGGFAAWMPYQVGQATKAR